MVITPVAFAIATFPAALYLLWVGWMRVGRKPHVTTGWRDAAAVGLAIMGLVAVGPMQLFFPTYAAARFAGWVWAMLAALYLLTLLLVVLSRRPRLMVYGLCEEDFFQALYAAARRVDAQSEWHGQVLTLPSAGMQLVVEPTGSPAVQQAVCLGGLASVASWTQLQSALVDECAAMPTAPGRIYGFWLSMLGAAMLLIATLWIMADTATAVRELREFVVR